MYANFRDSFNMIEAISSCLVRVKAAEYDSVERFTHPNNEGCDNITRLKHFISEMYSFIIYYVITQHRDDI